MIRIYSLTLFRILVYSGKEGRAGIEYEKEYRRIYEELTVEGFLADGPNSDSFVINSACSHVLPNKEKKE